MTPIQNSTTVYAVGTLAGYLLGTWRISLTTSLVAAVALAVLLCAQKASQFGLVFAGALASCSIALALDAGHPLVIMEPSPKAAPAIVSLAALAWVFDPDCDLAGTPAGAKVWGAMLAAATLSIAGAL